MFGKIVRICVLLLLFYAVGMSTFNFINSHELAGMFGSDVGFLKGDNHLQQMEIEELKDGVSLSHNALRALIAKDLEQDIKIGTNDYFIEEIWQRIDELEKDVEQCLVKNEHLWYHYKQTRKNQNDIFRILEEIERTFKEHYHGPKPLLY
jgi:hypothetical protein